MGVKRHIHTTIPEELFKRAKKRKITWQDAIKKGIESMLDLDDEKALLESKYNWHYNEMEKIRVRINDINKIIDKNERLNLNKVLNLAYEMMEVEGENISRDVIQNWGIAIDMHPDELFYEIKEYVKKRCESEYKGDLLTRGSS
jgi:predicted nuclease with TOPRIM domain